MSNEEKLKQLDEIIEKNGGCPEDENGDFIICGKCILNGYHCGNLAVCLKYALEIKKELEGKNKMKEVKEPAEKLPTMQEYADEHGMYVAMDKDGCIWAYMSKPEILSDNRWYPDNENAQRIDAVVQTPTCDWHDSLCTPKKKEIKKTYDTPCGTFTEGETIITDGIYERIFYSYDERLKEPYLCVSCWFKNAYKNNKKFTIATWDKIEKLSQKRYKPYSNPDMEWIGKEIKLKKPFDKDEPNRVISGFEKLDGIWNVLFEHNYCRDLKECFETTTWADGSVFGDPIK